MKNSYDYKIYSMVIMTVGFIVALIPKAIPELSGTTIEICLGITGAVVIIGAIIYASIKMRCPYCKRFLSIYSSGKYCPHCGKSFESPVYINDIKVTLSMTDAVMQKKYSKLNLMGGELICIEDDGEDMFEIKYPDGMVIDVSCIDNKYYIRAVSNDRTIESWNNPIYTAEVVNKDKLFDEVQKTIRSVRKG